MTLTSLYNKWSKAYPGQTLSAPSFKPSATGRDVAARVLAEAQRQGATDAVLLEDDRGLTVAAVFKDPGLALDMSNVGGLSKEGRGFATMAFDKTRKDRFLELFTRPKSETIYAGRSGWDMSIG